MNKTDFIVQFHSPNCPALDPKCANLAPSDDGALVALSRLAAFLRCPVSSGSDGADRSICVHVHGVSREDSWLTPSVDIALEDLWLTYIFR